LSTGSSSFVRRLKAPAKQVDLPMGWSKPLEAIRKALPHQRSDFNNVRSWYKADHYHFWWIKQKRQASSNEEPAKWRENGNSGVKWFPTSA